MRKLQAGLEGKRNHSSRSVSDLGTGIHIQWWHLQGYQLGALIPHYFMDEITKYPEGSVVRPYICRFTWFFLFIQSHCRLFSGALMAWWWPWPHTPSLLETWLCTWWQMLWSLHPLNRSWLSSHVQYLPQAEEEFAVVWSRWLWCRLGSTTSTAHLEEDFSRGPNARSAMTQCPWSRKHQGFCSTVGQLGVAGAWLSDQWPEP